MKYLIDFKNNVTQEQIIEYINTNNLSIVSTYNSFEKVFLVESSVEPLKNELTDYVIQDENNPIQLLTYPKLEGSQFPTIEYDTNAPENWWRLAVQRFIDFDKVNQIKERRGQTTVVYLVDSGVMVDHPEFEFSTIENLYSFNNDFTDHNGHGTALASVLCGKNCSMSDPTVKSVKIFQSGVDTLRSHMLAALDSILNDAATIQNKFKIVNISWSIPKDLYIESKIQTLINAGIGVVAAAGNNGSPIENVTPACMLEVCTVGAFDSALTPCNFSNYTGPITTTQGLVNHGDLDIWAPGEDIRVAYLNGTYGLTSGTSFSAAIQSAAIAYNSNFYVFSDGSLVPFDSITALYNTTKAKQNLMVLDDQYSDNSNWIATFYAEYDGDGGSYNKFTGKTIIANSGSEVAVLLAPFVAVSSVAIRDTLPTGFTQDGNWIRGVTTTETIQIFESVVEYTTRSGSIYYGPFQIIVLPEGQTLEQADPTLNITLLGFCSYGEVQNGYCIDDCANFGQQCQYFYSGKTLGACNCGFL